MVVRACGATHRGARPANEDAFLVDVGAGLFVVADGMGGHNAGEVASSLAIESIQQSVDPAHRTAGGLQEAVEAANRHVLDTAATRPELAGMGTTVSAALLGPSGVLLANVGDSRVYRLRGETLTQLTHDDSWIARLLADGVPLTASDIERHPMRHVLTKVVGARTELDADVQQHTFEPGDALLLCSDGLHGVLGPDALADILGRLSDVQAAAEALVAAAVARGAQDNVTAVVLRRDA